MIIDADVHISPFSHDQYDLTVDRLLREMDKAGIDRALTWLRPPYMGDISAANRYVYESARAHPDRLLPFGWADPHYGLDAARDGIRRCVEEYGCYGIKLNGAQNQFMMDDPQLALPLVETVARLGVVMAFHTGADAFEFTHPYRLGRIAGLFPELRILMVHLGGVAFHDLSAAAIEVLQEHANVTAVGSGVRATSILRALKAVGPERVCFGSDTPFAIPAIEVAMYRALLEEAGLSEQERQLVWSGNIARVLGIAA